MPAREVGSQQGMWPWLIQRITGAILLVFLGLHFFITHFAVEGNINFQIVNKRFLQSPAFWYNWDWLLLGIALFHGVNGIRAIILDFGVKQATARILFWLMIIICVTFFVYGFTALSPFKAA